jgi:DNA-binding MarR family transcriptional regulator
LDVAISNGFIPTLPPYHISAFPQSLSVPSPISNLNKIFDSRIRIGVMSALMGAESATFNELKALMEVTDGNLATHLKTLEDAGFVKVSKGFVGRKTSTTYTVTKAGDKAFRAHLDALEQIIRSLE